MKRMVLILAALLSGCGVTGASRVHAPHPRTGVTPYQPLVGFDDERPSGRAPGAGGAELRDGDIVFQYSTSEQADAIRVATGSPLTHVGVLQQRDGVWFVIEAREGVTMRRLSQFASTGRGRNARAPYLLIMRLEEGEPDFGPMEAEARRLWGRPYDLGFEQGDERLYCSELVHLLYRESGVGLGEWAPIRSFELTAEVEAHRIRRGMDLDQEVISPASIAQDEQLCTVATWGALPQGIEFTPRDRCGSKEDTGS